MSTIKISELRPVGSEFFQDSESYLNELSDREVEMIGGGRKFVITSVINVYSQASVSQGISLATISAVSAFTNP